MNNILYVIPNLSNVSGGPKTRVSLFKNVFLNKKDDIIEKGKSLIALKNMTINEPFFQGHFPGQPVMPGVLSLEIMAQAGSFLMLSQIEDPLSMNMFFSTVESAKFRKPITPGDQLKVHMELAKRKLNLCKFHGKCFVDEVLVAEAKFAANLVDRAKE